MMDFSFGRSLQGYKSSSAVKVAIGLPLSRSHIFNFWSQEVEKPSRPFSLVATFSIAFVAPSNSNTSPVAGSHKISKLLHPQMTRVPSLQTLGSPNPSFGSSCRRRKILKHL